MIFIFLRDGNCIEVEAAVGSARRNDSSICFDSAGREVATIPFAEVEAYSQSERMARLLAEDICDDVKLIPEKPEEQPRGGSPLPLG